MTPYITPDGAVPSPVNQTIFWLDPSTGGWYQKHLDMGYCRVELTVAQAKQLVPHDQTPAPCMTETGVFPPIHSLSSIAQSALEPSGPGPKSPEPSAPAESTLTDPPTVVVVVSSAAPTVRFNPLQTPVYDSTVVEEVSVPASTVRPELPRPPPIKELIDVDTPKVTMSIPKLAPITTVTPSPQADKSRVSLYMQLPGKVGVDYFYEFATCLRCNETGTHALSCALYHEYPTALVVDKKGFCLQAQFQGRPPKPSNYGLEPYTYYPIRMLVAYQFREQPGRTSITHYLHKVELRAPTLHRPLASSTPVYGHDVAELYSSKNEKLHPLNEVSPSSSTDSDWERAARDFNEYRVEAGRHVQPLEANDPDDDPAQEQPFEEMGEDPPLFPETVVHHKSTVIPEEMEKARPSPARRESGEHASRKNAGSRHFHYRNPPMWTSPTGLILTGWRMCCPVCYHQDGHSATCSERQELPVILWIQLMFIHGIVHYMTYADGEWWHDQDPKPRQLWGRGHSVHRLDEGTDCLLEWGASFPKGKHERQMVSSKFLGDVLNLDLTTDSAQGRDGFIDDPYVPGDQGYRPLPR